MIPKRLIFFSLGLMFAFSLTAQQVSVYHPEEDASAALKQAIQKASIEGKHVFITIGGNWCPWCVMLDGYLKEHSSLDSIIRADYIPLKINYSREVPNLPIMEQLEYPNRFGFPVIVILNEKGERIHTQNSAYLEEGKSYDEKKWMDFFKGWNYKALHPEKK